MDSTAFKSWGARNYSAIEAGSENGLAFKTSGNVVKGCTVHIIYDEFSDLYRVIFSRTHDNTYINDLEYDGVYFTKLITIINAWVLNGVKYEITTPY